MSVQSDNEKLVEEIGLFIQYCVAESEIPDAVQLVKNYQSNELILRLLKMHYSTLPEAREEPVVKIAELMHHQGVYLFVVSCTNYSYIYAISSENVLFLAEYRSEISEEILNFFGYASQKDFLNACPPIQELEEYRGDDKRGLHRCPACGVEEGEMHLLGCVVEVCPWCDGQLCSCNCRFEQLETEEIEDEEQLDSFIDLLDEKGRIPYSRTHSPAYPGTSSGLDEG